MKIFQLNIFGEFALVVGDRLCKTEKWNLQTLNGGIDLPRFPFTPRGAGYGSGMLSSRNSPNFPCETCTEGAFADPLKITNILYIFLRYFFTYYIYYVTIHIFKLYMGCSYWNTVGQYMQYIFNFSLCFSPFFWIEFSLNCFKLQQSPLITL